MEMTASKAIGVEAQPETLFMGWDSTKHVEMYVQYYYQS